MTAGAPRVHGSDVREFQLVVREVANGRPSRIGARVVCACGTVLDEHEVGTPSADLRAQAELEQAVYLALAPPVTCSGCGRVWSSR